MDTPGGTDILSEFLYYPLSEQADRVRWRITDIPWSAIDRSAVGPSLVRLVREAAYSELTTYTATRQFLQEFVTDADFTQWVSVWFFEETRHPEVLMRWLAHFGETFDPNFIRRGRVTTPFMKSAVGTLVTNIVSEMFASASYVRLSRSAREPVLSLIAMHLARDEARHASSFYSYARRAIERSPTPDLDRLAAVKVLYYWLTSGDGVTHPVSELQARAASSPELAEAFADVAVDMEAIRARVSGLIGMLIGRPLDTREAIMEVVRELSESTRQQRARDP